MSGWIKVEKDLETDPRVTRIARTLSRRLVVFDTEDRRNADTYDPCNACAFQYVTLVCGALARLWIFADSHAREDDTLDMGFDEINDWLGIPGFCQMLPEDWIVAVDERTVELPGFQSHNGVEAKKKALTQKRVERHRLASSNATALPPANYRNATALPDQTRPDQTIQESVRRTERAPRRTQVGATRLPDDFTLTTERRLVAEGERLPADRTFAKFCDYWRSASGSKAKKLDWDATWRNWCRTEADRALASTPRGVAAPLQLKPAPTEAEISESRRKAAADNVKTMQRLGLAAAKAMP